MTAIAIFDQIFGDPKEPTEESLRAEMKRLIEALAEDETGKNILSRDEWDSIWHDLKAVHEALRYLQSKPAHCLECGSFGQLVSGFCIHCR